MQSMMSRSLAFGGLHGVRDENALESAIMAAQNVFYYGGGDVYEIAVGGLSRKGAEYAKVFPGVLCVLCVLA
jgi:hypothetical protein